MANRTVYLSLYIKPNYTGVSQTEVEYSKTGADDETLYLEAELPALPAGFEREGYDFLGYGMYSSQSSGLYQPGDKITYSFPAGTSRKTDDLYCIWRLKTYTIDYSANGGEGAPERERKNYGQATIISSTEPTRSGFIFQGWAKSSTGEVVYQPGDSYTANESVTLYAIWGNARSRILTITSPQEIGEQGTATWDIINAAYSYKLELNYEDAPTVTINPGTNVSSATYTIPVSWLNYLPDSTEATARAKLTTYNGAQVIGVHTKEFKITVPSSIVPTISSFTAAPYNDNATVAGWDIYLQGYSKVDLSVAATPGTGANIISIKFKFNESEFVQDSLATTARTNILTGYGTRFAEVTVTDSRGRISGSLVAIAVEQYFNPEVSAIDIYRCLSDGTRDDINGTYARITPRFSFSDCDSNNTLTVNKISDKLHTATSWTDVLNGATSGGSYTIGGNFNIALSYDIRCMITDSLGNSAALIVTLPPTVGFALGLKNDRARFGGPTEKPGLQVDWVSEFNKQAEYNDKAIFNGVVDLTNRRSVGALSSAGWYRVIEFDTNIIGGSAGFFGCILDIKIVRSADITGSSEAHSIKLILARSNISGDAPIIQFLDEKSASGANGTAGTYGITKIRYSKTTNEKTGYIDIYYNLSTESPDVTVSFEAAIQPENQEAFSPVQFTNVSATQTGETVVTSYDFSADTDADEVTYTALGKSWYLRKKNGIVYLNAPSSITSANIGSNYIYNGAIPKQFRPVHTCYFPVADYVAATDYYLVVERSGIIYLQCGEQITSSRNCAITACWVAQ